MVPTSNNQLTADKPNETWSEFTPLVFKTGQSASSCSVLTHFDKGSDGFSFNRREYALDQSLRVSKTRARRQQ